MSTHTPTPWVFLKEISGAPGRPHLIQNAEESKTIADVRCDGRDFDYIERCVNAHEELVAACKEWVKRGKELNGMNIGPWGMAERALASVEGK